MTDINIEYCVPCGLQENAIEVQHVLLDEFGQELDGVTLSPGHGGVFKVHVDDELIWDKEVHGGDVDLSVLTEAVHQRTTSQA